jgi:hypothetical protein
MHSVEDYSTKANENFNEPCP